MPRKGLKRPDTAATSTGAEVKEEKSVKVEEGVSFVVDDFQSDSKQKESTDYDGGLRGGGLSEYLKSSAALLKTFRDAGPGSEDQRKALLSSVAGEMEGKEMQIARDQRASRRLEDILRAAAEVGDQRTLSKLIIKLAPDGKSFFELSCDQYGAHVVQTAVSLLRDLPESDLPGKIVSFVVSAGHMDSLMKNYCATHVIRALARSLAGLPPVKHSVNPKGKYGKGSNYRTERQDDSEKNPRSDLIKKLNDGVAAYGSRVPDMVCDPYASPCIQQLLELHPTLSLLRVALGFPSGSPMTAEGVKGGTRVMDRYMSDKCGSHALQVFVKVGYSHFEEEFKAVSEEYLKPMAALIVGGDSVPPSVSGKRYPSFGLFVLQAIFESVTRKRLQDFSCLDLKAFLNNSLGRGGFFSLVKLAEAFARVKGPQMEFLKSLKAAMEATSGGNGEDVWRLFLSVGRGKICDDGCLLMSTLFKFQPKSLVFFLGGPPSDLIEDLIGLGKAGKKFLEAVVGAQSPLSYAKKCEIIENIVKSDHFKRLSLDRSNGGSWLVSALWEGSIGANQKSIRVLMAEAFLGFKEELRQMCDILWVRCGMNEFEADKSGWEARQEKQGKAKRMFEEIVDGHVSFSGSKKPKKTPEEPIAASKDKTERLLMGMDDEAEAQAVSFQKSGEKKTKEPGTGSKEKKKKTPESVDAFDEVLALLGGEGDGKKKKKSKKEKK